MRLDRDGFSVEAAIKKQRPLPDWYLDEPDLPEGAEFFMAAFRDLVTCRAADGPIPWTAVRLYAEDAQLEPDTRDLLWSVMRAMDQAERSWVANQKPRGNSG